MRKLGESGEREVEWECRLRKWRRKSLRESGVRKWREKVKWKVHRESETNMLSESRNWNRVKKWRGK